MERVVHRRWEMGSTRGEIFLRSGKGALDETADTDRQAPVPPAGTAGLVRRSIGSLGAKFFLLILLGFVLTAGVTFASLSWVYRQVVDDVGMLFAEKQALYDRERSLAPIRREVTLATMLATSPTIVAWAADEEDAATKARGLAELENFRRAFADGSVFFAIAASRHYYFNDAERQYAGRELRYTLDPNDEEDRWFFATMDQPETCLLNVDFDEKIQVTKLWINCVVRDEGEAVGVIGTGIDLSTFIRDVISLSHDNMLTMFLDDTGAIQAHRNPNFIDFRSISKSVDERKKIFALIDRDDDRDELREAMRALRRGARPAATMFLAIDGRRYLAGISYIHEFGWFNVTLMGIDQLIEEYFVPTAALLLAALLLLLFVAGVLAKFLVLDRISRLDRSVRSVTEGMYDFELDEGPGDEIGRLGSRFRLMADTVRETTENLEENVRRRTAELRVANETKDRLLSIIAHDLRGSVGLVRMVTHDLADSKEWEPELVAAAKRSADHAFELLEDLMKWASSQASGLRPDRERFRLRPEVEKVLSAARDPADEKSIELRCDVPEDVEAFADVEMVRTILRNLVTNSIKFSEDGGRVRVSARVEASKLHVDVEDHGIGIAVERQARLFQIGDRNVSTPGTREEHGSGLGLILCKQLAEKHGGDILMESAPGRGSTFTLVIPLLGSTEEKSG